MPISRIRISDGHTTAEIRTQEGEDAPTYKCGKPLGLLVKPVLLKVDLDGKPATILIPARGAAAFQNGGCSKDGSPLVIQIDLKDPTKHITIDMDGTQTKKA